MADDLYRSISVNGVAQAQADKLFNELSRIPNNPCDLWGTYWDPATGIFEMVMGMPYETTLATQTAFLANVRTTMQTVTGRIPNASVSNTKGEKCATARDRQKEMSSVLGRFWNSVKQVWEWLMG